MCLIPFLLCSPATAADRQVIGFRYDSAGNLIEKNTDVIINSVSPSIGSIAPTAVRHNISTAFTLGGTDLKNVQIVSDDINLTVSNISTSSNQATFDLFATNDVPLGTHTLTFSTLSGQSSQTVQVFPQLPELVIRPTPLALAVGENTAVAFGIGSVDVVDHQILVNVANTAIASVSANNFTIVSGKRFPTASLTLNALQVGQTTISFSSAELGDLVFTLIVSNAYLPPPGTQVNVRSDILGMVLPSNSPDIVERGPITDSLTVFLPPIIIPINSVQRLQVSAPLGVVYGSAYTSILPNAIAANTSRNITVKGFALSSVTGITINPPEDITITNVQVNQAGTEITATISVNPGTVFSARSIELLTAGLTVKPVSPETRKLFIGGQSPSIKSIAPILVSRLSKQTLNVIGKNFEGEVKVSILPADDVAIGNLVTLNGDRTELSVDLSINEFAAIGARVISVETANGVTTANASETNTLTITNGINGQVPVHSAPLGIVVGSNSALKPPVSLFSSQLGLIRGAGVLAVQPLQTTRDTSITLTMDGIGLDTVTAVNFTPDQGIIANAPQSTSDGRSLSVDLIIAADAAATTRQLSVSAGATKLRFTKPSLTRFAVLGAKPQVDFISPNFIVAGSITTVEIHGQALESVATVRLEPANDLTISPPQINADNTIVSVQITADSNAQRSARTLLLGSNAGESSAVPSALNQLTVVNTETLVINNALVSPLLGIIKGNNSVGTTTRNFTITSPLLGVTTPEQAVVINQSLYSQPLSIVKGSYINTISPKAIQTGITAALTITGVSLQNATSIELIPADDLLVQTPLTINPAATEISVNIVVATNAAKTPRQIIVHQSNTTNNALPYIVAENARILVTGETPVIESIDPVLQVANSQFELLIRGQNLQEVTAVHAYGSNAVIDNLIAFGNPSINSDGSELRVTVVVDRLVPAGIKAIVLTVPIGQTSAVATAVNTLTINTLTP